MAFAWVFLLNANFVTTEQGGYERTGTLLWLVIAQSLWLTVPIIALRTLRIFGRDRVQSNRMRLDRGEGATRESEVPSFRGLRFCCDGLAVALLILISYHVVVPSSTMGIGYLPSTLAGAGSAMLASVSCFCWLRRSWSEFTAGVFLAHLSLVICSLGTLLSLREGRPLRELYPATFSAMMIGCCFAAGLCAMIAVKGFGRRQSTDNAPTFLSRLTPVARRFAFLNVALAFLVGVLMMVWPRMPAVATMDDSLARVTAGLSAILFLLLVVLWCGRRLHQPVFHVMSVLTVLLAGGFLLVRVLPFSSHVG